ncbi:carbohydrate ABC transporter permease [Kitasatospora sp. NPDC050543]|uniref:carbohydrate ABC transporter permease n=1 Tax=Kitasatospora sp. NPDC050543 TaxID=3364054 RepID=UPI00378C2A6A
MSVTTNDTLAEAAAPAPAPAPPRRRGLSAGDRYIPYVMILPAAAALVAVMGYPLFKLLDLALQNINRYAALVNPDLARYIGLEGFTKVFSDDQFWEVVLRSFVFTGELVALSMGLGMTFALILGRVSAWVKIVVVTVLMFVWAVPALVSGTIFRWIFAGRGGIADYVLYLFGADGMKNYEWVAHPAVGLYVVGAAVIVWGALPFLVIGLHAALTQVPKELVEASKLDGANVLQTFWHVVIPVIKPFLLVSASLSFIWDFQVFAQIYSLRNSAPEPEYWTIGTYLYQNGVVSSHYSNSAVISISMIVLMLAVLVFYIRQVIKIGAQD